MTDEERFANLEATVAFQDRTIAELNQAILREQARIDRLEAVVERLRQRPASLVRDLEDEEPPPHY